MRLSFKTGVFLATLVMAVFTMAQSPSVQAEMTAASTAANSADTTANLNAELEEKRARAAKNRDAMQQKVKDGNKKFNDLADMDESDQKEVDARVKKMLGEHPDTAQPITSIYKDVSEDKKPRRRIIKRRSTNNPIHQNPSREAPVYLKDSLELVKALEKKHAPYTLPPLKKDAR